MLNKLQINSLVTSALLLPTLALTAHEANAHPLDFVFHNSNSYPVWELYVSSNSTDNWEEDVLAADILPGNESVRINFNGDVDNCLYDIKAVFKDGSYQEAYEVNLCEVSEVTL
ncbi:MAG TPA: hypothetical protein ACFCUY_06600 [Xenococcaceae cyanobacterium]